MSWKPTTNTNTVKSPIPNPQANYQYGNSMTDGFAYNWTDNTNGYVAGSHQPSYRSATPSNSHTTQEQYYYRSSDNKLDERWQEHKQHFPSVVHGKSEIVEPMIQLSHQGHQITGNASLYQHERTPVLVPNPHYLKFQQKYHTVPPSPSSSYYSPTVDFAQRSDSSSQSGSPIQQRASQDISSPRSSVSNSPNTLSKPKPSRGNRSYQCPQCVKVFRRGDHLKRHLLSVHDHEHPYQCGDCGKGFANVSSLAKHSRSLHADTTTKGHLCLRCKIPFQSNIELEAHASALHVKEDQEYMQTINSSSKQHACTFCSKTFTSIANVKKHVQLLHKNKTNQKSECEVCGKVFTRPDSLRKHKQREHPSSDPPINESTNLQNETTSLTLKKESTPTIPIPMETEEKIEIKPKINPPVAVHPHPLQNEPTAKNISPVKKDLGLGKINKAIDKKHKDNVINIAHSTINEIKEESETFQAPLLVSEAVSNAMKTLLYFAHDPIPGLHENEFTTNLNDSEETQHCDESHQSIHEIDSFLLHKPPPALQVPTAKSFLTTRNDAHLVPLWVGGG